MNVRNLEQTLAYEHAGVTEKLQSVYGVSAEEAADLFLEAKRWLWLSAKFNRDTADGLGVPQDLAITPSLTMLDEAWHTFILFTHDYLEFCRDYLGQYIHHQPNAGQHAEAHADLTPMLRQMMEYVYDQLGRDTLIKWYSDYHDKYAGLTVRFTMLRPGEQAVLPHESGVSAALAPLVRDAGPPDQNSACIGRRPLVEVR